MICLIYVMAFSDCVCFFSLFSLFFPPLIFYYPLVFSQCDSTSSKASLFGTQKKVDFRNIPPLFLLALFDWRLRKIRHADHTKAKSCFSFSFERTI
jgi:hypothetical protein